MATWAWLRRCKTASLAWLAGNEFRFPRCGAAWASSAGSARSRACRAVAHGLSTKQSLQRAMFSGCSQPIKLWLHSHILAAQRLALGDGPGCSETRTKRAPKASCVSLHGFCFSSFLTLYFFPCAFHVNAEIRSSPNLPRLSASPPETSATGRRDDGELRAATDARGFSFSVTPYATRRGDDDEARRCQ